MSSSEPLFLLGISLFSKLPRQWLYLEHTDHPLYPNECDQQQKLNQAQHQAEKNLRRELKELFSSAGVYHNKSGLALKNIL